MGEIVPRWEWRTFASDVPTADAVFAALEPAVEESEELYLLSRAGDNVKIRAGLMDVKVLRETDASGLQRWEPILKATFPLDEEAARVAFRSLDRPLPDVPPEGLDLDAALAAAGVGTPGGPRALLVHKRRARYTVAGCLAEVAVLEVEGRRTTSIAVESTDPSAVLATVEALGLSTHVNHDVPTGLRMLVDDVPERYAVIDAGTNSTKFHVAEIDPDSGAWRTVVDRAVVTRLGEDLDATGSI
jgi:exopolyphosphatase / guanosine-5'-triphosphate,3'-diphosphate pyrophosphatase